MDKLFEILTAVILLLLIIATTINVMYLLIFAIGLFFALALSFFAWGGQYFAGWAILSSLAAALLVFLAWILTFFVDPIETAVALSAIGGALFPSIAVSAYL